MHLQWAYMAVLAWICYMDRVMLHSSSFFKNQKMNIAIHQPNFFPYLGFFEKMNQVDVFVIMEHCQFEKGGYQNRFNIDDQWFSMSTGRKLLPIREKRYVNAEADWDRIKRNLPQYKYILDRFDGCLHKDLVHTNGSIIHTLAHQMGMIGPRKQCLIARDFPTQKTGSQRLLDICKHYGATEYLSGISGKKYLDEKLFIDAGIKVTYQESPTNKPILQHIHELGIMKR